MGADAIGVIGVAETPRFVIEQQRRNLFSELASCAKNIQRVWVVADLNDDDLAEFVELQKTFADSEQSWTVDAGDVDEEGYDLSVKNPNAPEEEPLRSPEEILSEIEALDAESAEVLAGIREML